jgi:hypothetical protein
MNPLTKVADANNNAPSGYDMKAGMPSAMASMLSAAAPDSATGNMGTKAENTKPPAFAKFGAGTGGTTTLGQGTQNIGLKAAPQTFPTPEKLVALDVNPVRQPAKPWKA